MSDFFNIPLSFPPGLNSDDTTFSATGRWADGSNVRFWEGKPQTIGGWVASYVFTGADDRIRGIGSVQRVAGDPFMLVGTNINLFAMNPGPGLSSVLTPAAFTDNVNRWYFDAWGSTSIAHAAGATLSTLYQWSAGVGGAFAEITQAPNTITSFLVTNERQVLAFGCNEEVSGTFNAKCIRGSDLEDFTNWTTTAANNAFEHILEGQGGIVTARKVGSYIAVWTTSGLHLGQFVGDPSQTYRFDMVAEGCGIIGHDAVTIYNGTAYWLAPNYRFYSWSPGGLPQAIPCPITKDFLANVNQAASNQIVVAAVPAYNEVWIHYPDSRDIVHSHNTRYIAVSLVDGSWFRGSGTGAEIIMESAAAAPFIQGYDPGAYVIGKGLTLYVQEHGNLTDTPSRARWFIQSADQYMDQGRQRVMVTCCTPDFQGQVGDVSLTVFVRDRPQSTSVTKGPFTLSVGATKKNFRASGMIVSAKFSGENQAGSYVRLGTPVFEAVAGGGR